MAAPLLIIEASATLRHALQKMLRQRGYPVTSVASYEAGLQLMRHPALLHDYAAVIVGFPLHAPALADELLGLLRGEAHKQLPVLILAHSAEAHTFDWVARRARSALLLWDDYTDCVDCLRKLIGPAPGTATPNPAGDIRILFVDDSVTVRAGFMRLLSEHGYSVEGAGDMREALDKARAGEFDIAIVDYFMPGGNGDLLCRALRSDPATAGIAAAVITGTYLDEVIKDSLEAGAVECMFKNEPTELFLARVAAMSRSIRTRKSIEQERRRLAGILASVGDGVYGVDREGRVTFINPAARAILGFPPEAAIIGESAHRLFHAAGEDGRPNSPDTCFLQQAYAAGDELQAWETVFWHVSGRPVPVECTVYPLKIDGRLEGSVVAFRDVTERRTFEKELTWQANHDPLTRLHNRYYFEGQLKYEVGRLRRSDETSALLYIDLDRFKYINDTAGHAAGDQLLMEIAAQLQTRLRESDLLARLGGDEFAVILRNIEPAAVRAAAEGFRDVLEQYDFVHGTRTYKVNGSIGVALLNKTTASPGEALANADIACHIAKGRGRNQTHVYQPESDAKVAMTVELGWSVRLQDALKNDRFVLHYQPIVPARPGHSDGGNERRSVPPPGSHTGSEPAHYEVLVRYLDAHGEVVPPNAFLPTAERFGIMPQVDLWVLTRAIEKLAALQAAGQVVSFTVNISGQTLDAGELVPLLKRLVRQHAVDPRLLILEITETSAIANLDAAKRLIEDLRALGCRFALDDFGSGFSSFHHLKHLPVDFVKIDGQFVRGMVDNSADRAIVASINEIAHSFGKQTVAEYVENQDILDMLTQYGVDYVQGFHISSPRADVDTARLMPHGVVGRA